MHRRHFLLLSSAAAASLPFRGLSAQQAPPAWTPKFEPIRRNVGYFTARGGTIGWLQNGDALVIVDTQYADTAQACVDGLKQRAAGRQIDLVINTHHHGDHTGGNAVFKSHAKRIVAHARVPELMKQVAAAAPPNPNTPPPTPVLPDATFEKTWSERFGDEQVTARHYGPGHTGGDAVIHFERAQVVHMGDLLFHERHPRVDRPAGASIQNWITTIETVAKAMPGDTLYIAGHSKEGLPVVVGRKELMRQRDYFDAVLKYAKAAIAQGKSKDETVKLETLAGFEGHQSSGTMLSLGGVLGVAYDELTSK